YAGLRQQRAGGGITVVELERATGKEHGARAAARTVRQIMRPSAETNHRVLGNVEGPAADSAAIGPQCPLVDVDRAGIVEIGREGAGAGVAAAGEGAEVIDGAGRAV